MFCPFMRPTILKPPGEDLVIFIDKQLFKCVSVVLLHQVIFIDKQLFKCVSVVLLHQVIFIDKQLFKCVSLVLLHERASVCGHGPIYGDP